jgi:hypothetical protein
MRIEALQSAQLLFDGTSNQLNLLLYLVGPLLELAREAEKYRFYFRPRPWCHLSPTSSPWNHINLASKT